MSKTQRVKVNVGDVYGQLTITKLIGSILYSGKKRKFWQCRCKCGIVVDLLEDFLKKKTLSEKSCGQCKEESFYKKTIKERNSWRSVVFRCYNPVCSSYKDYGGRGISVCDRWNPEKGGSFMNFYEDMGERPEGMTLDRIDPDGNYEPSNCRWATNSEQNVNKRRTGKPTSGKAGVNWHKKSCKWEVKISDNGKQIGLGMYDDFETAVKVRQDGELKYYGKLLPY